MENSSTLPSITSADTLVKRRYTDPSLPFIERANDLLANMTLDEKCSQLTYDSPAIDRLNIPSYNWWNECLHGVGRAGLATVFPQAIGLASTFNVELCHRVASAISDEARAKHHAHAARGDRGIYKGLTFWTPNINIFRDPRWGRGHETYGECPYLTSRMAVAFITGLQGDDAKYLKVVATPKHMAVHSGPENGRHGFDARVSLKDLNETYLPAFRAAVVEAKAFSVMGAYNRLNGVPCCASEFLLEKTLREKWGFEGYTVSDCGAITDIHAHHQVTRTPAESAALALKNGLDLCCGQDYAQLREAITAGLVTEETIDRSLRRLLLARFKLGMFDAAESVAYSKIPYKVVDCAEHRALSLEAARKSIVLLKNSAQLLPLKRTLRSVAVIGPNADARQTLLGNYHGTPSYTISPLDGIREKVGETAEVLYALGTPHMKSESPWVGLAQRGFVEAVLAAERADVTILCLGLNPTIEGEEGDAMNSDVGGDRTAIELPEIQQQLLNAIIAVGKPVVLVLIGGSAMAVPWAQENVSAIVQQFYPGQDGGTALADVLFGDHNPSGRLPITVYHATSDLPAFDDYAIKNRTYRFFTGEPLYPFGFGLSYTKFEYRDLKLSSTKLLEGQPLQVTATVQNVGKCAGNEIAQLYLQRADGHRQMAGFEAVYLPAGDVKGLRFTITWEQFLSVDNHGQTFLKADAINISVGGSQPDSRSRELGSPSCPQTTVQIK